MVEVPSHFTSVLLSNWQSAVARVSSVFGAASLPGQRSPLDLANHRLAAATAAAHTVDQAASAMPAPHDLASAALGLARALVNPDPAALVAAQAAFDRFGKADPFWLECITEFVEHYTLTRHSQVPYVKYETISDFVLPQSQFPANCTVAVVSDWGTGEARAQRLMEEIARQRPHILIHLGDIYYACTASEANAFYSNIQRAFPSLYPDGGTRVFTLCGNHDMYSGAAPYYALLNRLQQPASYFCLRNAAWQILAADTGYNDFNPTEVHRDATWVRDYDEGSTFSEMAWHREKLANTGARRTIMLTHHPLFTRNSSIPGGTAASGKQATNPYLMEQFGGYLPDIALWLWGHEHNQLVYAPFAGLQRGRCVGAGSIPIVVPVPLASVSAELAGQMVPDLIGGARTLPPEQAGGLYQLAYALLTFRGAALEVEYRGFDTGAGVSAVLYREVV